MDKTAPRAPRPILRGIGVGALTRLSDSHTPGRRAASSRHRPVLRAPAAAAYASRAVNGYLGMDIPRFVALVSARRRMLAGMAIGAAALALIASLTQAKEYQAGADLWFAAPTPAEALVPAASDPIERPERQAATNLALASLDTVAARVKARFGGRATIEELRDAVSIEPQGDSDVVTVSARSGSPTQAARVANAFATEIVALRREGARADVQGAIDAIATAIAARTASARVPGCTSRVRRRSISAGSARASPISPRERTASTAIADCPLADFT